MKGYGLIQALALACLFFATKNCYACNHSPNAEIANPDPTWVHINYDLCFDGYDSYDPDGYIANYWWNFDDDSGKGGTGHPPDCDGGYKITHAYANVDTYYPSLWVWDNGNPKLSNRESFTVYAISISLTSDSDYVTVNDDDDNNNGTPDNDPSETTVTGENDLVAIHLSVQPNNLSGEVELKDWSASEYLGAIKVWRYADKREQVIPDPSTGSRWKRWSPAALPQTLYVEGIASTSLDQARLALNYYAPSWGQVALPPGVGRVQLTVVKVDVAVSGLSETGELAPGKYVNVNWDDDDQDGRQPNDNPPDGVYTGDKDDPNVYDPQKAPNGDNDFRSFTVSISPQQDIVEEFPNSKVSITFPSKVRVWQTNTKKTVLGESSELTSGAEFVVENLPKQLYLEGVSGSSTFRDVELKATWLPCGFRDFVKVTVFEVGLTGLFGFGPQRER